MWNCSSVAMGVKVMLVEVCAWPRQSLTAMVSVLVPGTSRPFIAVGPNAPLNPGNVAVFVPPGPLSVTVVTAKGSPLVTRKASVNWLNCTVVPLAGWKRTTVGGCGDVQGGGGPTVSYSTSSTARPFVKVGAPPLSMPMVTRTIVAVVVVMASGVWIGVDVALGPSVTEACATSVPSVAKPRMTTVAD